MIYVQCKMNHYNDIYLLFTQTKYKWFWKSISPSFCESMNPWIYLHWLAEQCQGAVAEQCQGAVAEQCQGAVAEQCQGAVAE